MQILQIGYAKRHTVLKADQLDSLKKFCILSENVVFLE